MRQHLLTWCFVLLLALPACQFSHTRRVIELNRAMEDVHFHYLNLFYEVEFESAAGVNRAATDLLAALDDPAITGYSSQAEYLSSLEGTVAAVRQFLGPDPSRLLTLRKRVFRGCQSCHDAYRR